MKDCRLFEGVIDANEIVTNSFRLTAKRRRPDRATTLTHNTSDESQITLNIHIEPVQKPEHKTLLATKQMERERDN